MITVTEEKTQFHAGNIFNFCLSYIDRAIRNADISIMRNSKTSGILLKMFCGFVESCRSIGGILWCPCRRWVFLGSYNCCCGWKKRYQQQTLCTPEDHQNPPARRKYFNWSVYIKCLIQYIYQKETCWHWTEYIPDRILCLCHIHLHR